MANKNKGKGIKMLSPENYIRKKARSLPVYECWINEGWKDSGMANIVIARIHTNGNITFCLYLVDLYCLGVKDTGYKFNVTETEYRDFLERYLDRMPVEMTDYVLVHNIIFAAVEFAEDYGFKPHKDFTSVTEFMLEEDNEDIELIKIECGKKGKPLLVQCPYDDAAKINKIIKQLEHSAGAGNFDFIREVDFDDDGFDWGKNEKSSIVEMSDKFMQYFNKLDKLSDVENNDFLDLTQQIIDELIDINEHDRFYDELWDDLTQIEISENEVPNELLGINDKNLTVPSESKTGFLNVINGAGSLKNAKKQFKLFSKTKGIDAAIDYLDIVISGIEGSRKYDSKIEKAASKYPNYAVLQLKWTKHNTTKVEKPELLPHYPCKMENYFPGRESIHPWEYFCYLETFIHVVIAEKNFTKLQALKSVIYDLELNKNEFEILYTIISVFQVMFVESILNELNNPENL